MIYLWLGFYLLGSVVTYTLCKKDGKIRFGCWKKRHRNFALFLSIFSWAGASGPFISLLNLNGDEDASW